MAKERTIIAYFPSSTKAESAAHALEAIGLKDVHIKRASRFGVTFNPNVDSPIATAETLTGLTIFSQNTSKDDNNSARVLMGADPSVSGFSRSGNDLAGGHAFSIVAFTPENQVEQVVAILKENGGET
jgi:hypothetical protein